MDIKKEYVCNDNTIEPSDRIKNMTEEQIDLEFDRKFSKYLDED